MALRGKVSNPAPGSYQWIQDQKAAQAKLGYTPVELYNAGLAAQSNSTAWQQALSQYNSGGLKAVTSKPFAEVLKQHLNYVNQTDGQPLSQATISSDYNQWFKDAQRSSFDTFMQEVVTPAVGVGAIGVNAYGALGGTGLTGTTTTGAGTGGGLTAADAAQGAGIAGAANNLTTTAPTTPTTTPTVPAQSLTSPSYGQGTLTGNAINTGLTGGDVVGNAVNSAGVNAGGGATGLLPAGTTSGLNVGNVAQGAGTLANIGGMSNTGTTPPGNYGITGASMPNTTSGGYLDSLGNWIASPQGTFATAGLLNSVLNSPSTPSQPNLTAAAQQQYQNDLALLNAQTQANRPNQITPQGTISWTKDAQGNWTQTTALSPEQQKLYDQQTQQNLALGNMIGAQGQNVANSLNNQYSLNPGEIQKQASDAAYSQATHYLDPQFQREQAAIESQLTNQGLTRGTEAWNNAMNQFGEQKGQAYDQARNQAYTQGLMGANQTFNQSLAANQAPIMNYNLLRGGQTMTSNPNAPNFNNQGLISGPNILGATSDQYGNAIGAYNAQAAQNAGLTSGLFGLANTFSKRGY